MKNYSGCLLVGACVVVAAVGSGCASQSHGTPKVTSEMSTAEIRSAFEASIKPGMTLPEVNSALDGLGISDMRRRAYAGNPDQLLVRVSPRTGFWVDIPYQEFRYVDAWFVFDPQKRYERLDTVENRMRFQAGTWIDPPFQSPDVLPNQPRSVGP